MSIELQSHISQIRESATTNNFQNAELLSLAKDCISQNADKDLLHQLLDISHLSTISSHIHKTKQVDIWFNYLLEIIQLSRFNVGYLLKQRAEKYKEKIAFFVIKNGKLSNISYSSLWKKVVEIGKGVSSFKTDMDTSNYELDLRGFSVIEVKDILEKFLDNSLLNNEKSCQIYHGIGSRSIENEVHRILKGTKFVAKFTTHNERKGVTVVSFK